MDETVVITALALFVLLAAVCSIVFNRIKLPPLIGYIVAGIILANILFLYQDAETIEQEEEIVEICKDMGLVFLLFCIGLEININKLIKQGRFAVIAAAVQIPVLLVGGIVGGMLLGFDTTQSIVLGAILSGSSTAVIMACLKTQGNLDQEHIDTLVLVLIIEDIVQVVILSIITPMMASYTGDGSGGMDLNSIIALIIQILVFMIVSIVVGLRIIPRVINWISDNVSDEILTVTAVGLAFAMAMIASYVGLSIAVGAFLMGMMVASSRRAKEISNKIEPMRDFFMAMFFISIGTEIYPTSILLDNLGMILILFVLYVVLMFSGTFIGYWVGNENPRTGFISSFALCAMGEFAFIIASEALGYGVIDDSLYASVVGCGLLSMVFLPIISRYTARIYDKGVEKCPKRLLDACISLNERRSSVYDRLASSSKRSQKAVRRSFTYVYVDIVVIVIIEVVSYVVLQPASEWMYGAFGGNIELYETLILVINFLVLTIPTYYMINNASFLDRAIIRSAKRMADRGDDGDSSGYKRFLRFLELNTYLLVLVIDFLIILIVPNAVAINFWFYVLLLVAALAALAAIVWSRIRGRKEEEEEEEEMEEVA